MKPAIQPSETGLPVVAFRFLLTPIAIDYRGHSDGREWKGIYLFGLRLVIWRANTT